MDNLQKKKLKKNAILIGVFRVKVSGKNENALENAIRIAIFFCDYCFDQLSWFSLLRLIPFFHILLIFKPF